VTNARRTYTQAEELALTTQVGGFCPLCDELLFYAKKNRNYREYELAHIYPLNPSAEEEEELKDVARLHSDVNHPDNQIPLCTKCHTRFDKPRTRAEYEELALIKQKLIDKQAQRILMSVYPLEAEIEHVIASLNAIEFNDESTADLKFDAKSLDEKFDDSLPGLIRRKIKHAVTDYYPHIKRGFRDLELQTPMAAELIYSQVRTYYLKQRSLGLSQPEIFVNIVEWLRVTTDSESSEAPEIVASFFVQNCEVFD
jgi:hypothetical protein